jgi:hypothetical protein
MRKKNQDNIAAIYPLALFISTGIIWYHVSFITALIMLVGGVLSWFGSYAFLSALIYSRGKKRIILMAVQFWVTVGGYFILKNCNFRLGVFGNQIENYQFAYFSIFMGIVMAVLTKPDQSEIDAVQSQKF